MLRTPFLLAALLAFMFASPTEAQQSHAPDIVQAPDTTDALATPEAAPVTPLNRARASRVAPVQYPPDSAVEFGRPVADPLPIDSAPEATANQRDASRFTEPPDVVTQTAFAVADGNTEPEPPLVLTSAGYVASSAFVADYVLLARENRMLSDGFDTLQAEVNTLDTSELEREREAFGYQRSILVGIANSAQREARLSNGRAEVHRAAEVEQRQRADSAEREASRARRMGTAKAIGGVVLGTILGAVVIG